MVNPIHFQDNLSKAPLAQQFQDQENEGAEHNRDVTRQSAMKEVERRQRDVAQGMEEKSQSKEITPEGRQEKRQSGKKGKKRGRRDAGDVEPERENDLRFRRPEDDMGKGGSLDMDG